MIRKTTITMLTVIMALSAISITYAIPTFFGEDCTNLSDQFKTKVCDDLNNLNDRLVIQETQLAAMNTTLNDVTIRINELTTLHYPVDKIPIPVTIPEIVPLPEYPTQGENPEFAPNTPEIDLVIGSNEIIAINSSIMIEEIDDRYEDYPTVVLEVSEDGIKWNIGDEDYADNGYISQLQDRNVENYVEYLVRLYAYNEFGNSEYSLIWSGIPTEFSENTRISITDVTNSSVKITWDDVPTFTHTPLYWIIERSVNYGEFEVMQEQFDVDKNQHTDFSVVSGEIYSYRVTMVTDFETQTRSGFATVLIP